MATLLHSLAILASPIKSILKIAMRRLLSPAVAARELADGMECVICLSEIREGEEINREVRCKHAFHKCCLERWVEHRGRTCPLCRGQLLLDRMKEEATAEVKGWGGGSNIVFSPFSDFSPEDNWWIR